MPVSSFTALSSISSRQWRGTSDIADYCRQPSAAMYQALFGATDAVGAYQRPSRQTVLGALAGLAAAGVRWSAFRRRRDPETPTNDHGAGAAGNLKDAADFRLRDKHGHRARLEAGLAPAQRRRPTRDGYRIAGQGKSRGFAIPTMMSFRGRRSSRMSGYLFEETLGHPNDIGYETFPLAPGSKFTVGYNPL
ncbi:hypothetical protein ACOJBO_03855 [Rhizobium beringeri]